VLLTKVVARAVPFHCTTDDAAKLLPPTVRMKAAPPAEALLGASALSVGAGGSTVKVRAAEVPPPGAGVTTVTWAVPAAAMSLASIVA